MLADPRSEALTANFAGQWLQLRNLAAVTPSEVLFPDFDDTLRQGFRRETELFFDSVVREDRSAARPARRPTTRSSTIGWRGTTAFPTSRAATSAA